MMVTVKGCKEVTKESRQRPSDFDPLSSDKIISVRTDSTGIPLRWKEEQRKREVVKTKNLEILTRMTKYSCGHAEVGRRQGGRLSGQKVTGDSSHGIDRVRRRV